ncbi:MAG: hypothetical protein V3V16_15135 [Melioribacteraceae bacterium]
MSNKKNLNNNTEKKIEKKIEEKKKFRRSLFHKTINFFISLVGIFLFLLIIFFGFSQTKTFRNILRNKITAEVSQSFNANLQIDRLDGSILSSIILHNTVLYSEGDTLIDAKEIVIKTSPFHLLLKKIYIREVLLKDALIDVQQNHLGEWNFTSLFKQDTLQKEISIEDDEKSEFPFSIQVNDLQFQNVNFVMQNFRRHKSKRFYNSLNLNDFRLSNVFLNAKLFADISASTLSLHLNNLSFNPNFNSFNLNKLSCVIDLTKEYAAVKDLVILTDSSNIKIDAKIDELNLLGDVELKDFKEYPIALKAIATPFHFNDLSTFIDATNFLNGKADFDISASGTFGNLDVSKFNLEYLETKLKLTGNVKNLHEPEKLFFDVQLTDSELLESNIATLLPPFPIPNYKNLNFSNLNINFLGEPLNFNATLVSDVNEGTIELTSLMNLENNEIEYDIDYTCNNLNLFPIIDYETSLNSNGKVKGIGFDPNTMQADLDISINSSIINQINIDSLYLISSADSKIIKLDLNSIINNANTFVVGTLDLRTQDEPNYDLTGKITGLDLQTFTNELSDSSNLNFTFLARGKNLNIDDLVGNYTVKLDPSNFRGIELDESRIDLSLTKANEDREIKLISEFVDFNIDGKFSLQKAIDILTYEATTIASIISRKIDELNPIDIPQQNGNDFIITANEIVNEKLVFDFDFTFKDFELVALFLDNDKLDIAGTGKGKVENDSLNFRITTDVNIESLLNKREDDIIYLSNVNANIKFNRDNQELSFNKIFGTASLEGEKIFLGVELKDIIADLIFNQNKLFFNTSLGIGDDLTTELEGEVSTSTLSPKISFENIFIDYKNIEWENDEVSEVLFSDSGVELINVILSNDETVLKVDGNINNDETHDLKINVENLSGEVLTTYFTDEKQQPINSNINLDITSSGLLEAPKLKTNLYIDNISYDKVNFGNLTGILNYENNIANIDIDFIDKKTNKDEPILTIDGNIPLVINYKDTKDFILEDKDISLSIRSRNFNVGIFGNLLPFVKKQSGNILAEIDLSGQVNNIQSTGYLALRNGKFTYRDNNLDYSCGLHSIFENQKLTIDSLLVSNYSGSKYKGNMFGGGIIELKEFPFNKMDITISGDLALLGKKSKTRNATIYGDLFIKTEDDWKFTYENEKFNFDGNVIVNKANLVYASTKQNSRGKNEQIIYKFIQDTTNVNQSEQEFRNILIAFQNRNKKVLEELVNFDFKTNIIIKNISTFEFLMFPQFNQKLIVETTGQLEFESIDREFKTQGTLELLDGSRLEFVKTFDAKGNIRFESDVTDPHIDIVATYIGEVENLDGKEREDVAVKFKIDSPLSKLGESLSSDEDNLSVYVGRTDIDNDSPDGRFGASNALNFIFLNQLNLDLDEEQKSTLGSIVENTAYSLLGSQFSSYLNSALGLDGLISGIRVKKYGIEEHYKFALAGKYNNIRYSFGGNTEYLQLDKADLKVEYLLNPNFLVRVQQKDPIVETTNGEKIQELGLKLKFEF